MTRMINIDIKAIFLTILIQSAILLAGAAASAQAISSGAIRSFPASSTVSVEPGSNSQTFYSAPAVSQPTAPPRTDKSYLIQPYDILQIRVWPYEDLNLIANVRPDGTLSYPFLGEIKVEGFTAGEVADMVTKSLEKYMRNPLVAINVDNVREERAIILGEVKNPGQYVIRRGDTVFDIIGKAGGTTENARKSEVGIIRAPKEGQQGAPLPPSKRGGPPEFQGELTLVNLADVLGQAKFPKEYELHDRDVVFVPAGGKPDWIKINRVVNSLFMFMRLDEVVGLDFNSSNKNNN